MSNTRVRRGYAKSVEPMRPKKTEEKKPAAKPSKAVADWWKKPRIAQFNAGRFEFSLPYQAAIAMGLLLVLLLLGSYRLGQNSVVPDQMAGEVAKAPEKVDTQGHTGLDTASVERPSPPTENVLPKADNVPLNQDTMPIAGVTPDEKKIEEEVEPEEPKGKNVIVLAHSGRYADLVPVVEHFAEHGIDLKIVPLENGKYQLRTVERYERNPATPGTAGFEAKVKIRDVGRLYKDEAPAGLDTFAPNYFSDAYGKKVED